MDEVPLINGGMIRSARKRMGWSQAELAAKSGVSQSIISRLEREEAPYDCMLSNLLSLASTLMLPVSSLLHQEDDQNITTYNLEPTLAGVIHVLSQMKYFNQHQAALILDGYLTSLIYTDDDELKFSDVNVEPNSGDV